MRVAVRLVAVVLASSVLGGCGTKRQLAPSPEVTGTLTVDGQPLTVTACRPGQGVTIYVEAVTRGGVLRFEDRRLSWNREPLTCTQLDRSWGGGARPDGSAYWRGTLVFRCTAGPRTVTGDLTLDCGAITPEERRQLDQNRNELREEQQQAREAAGSGAAAGSGP